MIWNEVVAAQSRQYREDFGRGDWEKTGNLRHDCWCPAEIRTWHLPNSSPELQRYTTSLGDNVCIYTSTSPHNFMASYLSMYRWNFTFLNSFIVFVYTLVLSYFADMIWKFSMSNMQVSYLRIWKLTRYLNIHSLCNITFVNIIYVTCGYAYINSQRRTCWRTKVKSRYRTFQD
jgi:hypothetical protein